jgi:hypothetical protein
MRRCDPTSPSVFFDDRCLLESLLTKLLCWTATPQYNLDIVAYKQKNLFPIKMPVFEPRGSHLSSRICDSLAGLIFLSAYCRKACSSVTIPSGRYVYLRRSTASQWSEVKLTTHLLLVPRLRMVEV